MKLILTLLVRDEIDVIKGMLDFHFSQGIDHIIITDNGSVDGTLEICQAYEKSHNVELLIEPPSDFSQHRWVSKMANMAYEKYAADWIIHADADELFVPNKSYNSIKDYLETIGEDISILNIPRTDFVPFERLNKCSPHIEMVYRKALSLNIRGKVLPPKVVHRGSSNVKVSQGNHMVTGDFLQPNAQNLLSKGIQVYHYPIRSYPQFKGKVNNGGSGYSNNKELSKQTGYFKRHWYDMLKNNQLEQYYYQSHEYTSEKLIDAIDRNEIIEDRRIENFFNQMYSQLKSQEIL